MGSFHILVEGPVATASVVRDLVHRQFGYPDNWWISGGCATLALGVSLFLDDDVGLRHEIWADNEFRHVWVSVGRVDIDGDSRWQVSHHREVRLTRDDLLSPDFTVTRRIAINPRRATQVRRVLAKAWGER